MVIFLVWGVYSFSHYPLLFVIIIIISSIIIIIVIITIFVYLPLLFVYLFI